MNNGQGIYTQNAWHLPTNDNQAQKCAGYSHTVFKR